MKLLNTPYSLSLTQERRHGRRQKMDAVVYVIIDQDNGGVLLDLSEGGMCISVANPLILSSEIRFTLRLDENRPIEGTGKVSWLSESGKSAGVQFSYFSNESRMRLRQWLAGRGEVRRETATVETGLSLAGTATQDAASALGPQASAQAAGTETASGNAWHVPGAGEHAEPQTPLFFLPKRPAADELYDEVTWQPETHTWPPARTGTESEGESVEAFRSALIPTPEKEGEESSPEERHFKKNIIVLTICFLLLAGGAAAIVAYPKQFSQLRQFTASLTASLTGSSEPTSVAPSEHLKPERRIRRRAAKPPMFVARGPQRGSHPVRDSAIFDAPRNDSTDFAVTTNDSTNSRLLAGASGQKLVRNDAPISTPAAVPGSSSYSGDNPSSAANSQSSEPAIDASLQPAQETRRLRVDGGFLDEGAVSPTFAPLNLDGQTLSPKPIVVEAVIGKDGEVENARLVSAPSSRLAEAVVSAVKQWRYRPLYRDGQPIEFVTRITFNFSLPNANTQ
jgi:TonB family protein